MRTKKEIEMEIEKHKRHMKQKELSNGFYFVGGGFHYDTLELNKLEEELKNAKT